TVITATLTVIKATNCVRLVSDKVDINDTTGAFHVRGINLNGSNDCVHTDCRINTMVAGSGGSIIRGICLENGSTTNLFQNCFVQKLTCTTFVDGFISDILCDDNVFTNCTAFLNRALDVTGAAHGFRAIANNRNEFRLCTARRNSSFSTANTPLYGAYGFKMDSTNSTYI